MSESVRNAADEAQVKEASNKEKRGREREIDDLVSILSTKHGRRFYWRMLTECKTYHSIWEPSAKIHYNAGRQDVGHFLMAEAIAASPDLYLKMVNESEGVN